MPFSASLQINVRTDGHDTNCGGGFDPGMASIAFATNLTGTDANTASPVVSSATYSFVAGDVGAWVYIHSGTNWRPGWYEIASVAGGAATLRAAVGEGVRTNALGGGLNVLVGVASVASPTSGSWAVDYSRQAAAQWSYTDLVIGATNTDITSAAFPFGPNHVGNVISVTGGTGFTVQRIGIISIQAGNAARCEKAVGTSGSTGGVGGLGGALASTGQAGQWQVAGVRIHVRQGTYNVTSLTNNVANGTLRLTGVSTGTAPAMVIGYGTRYYDGGTRPVLTASGIGGSGAGLIEFSQAWQHVIHIAFDLNNASLLRAVMSASGTRLLVQDCTMVNVAHSAVDLGTINASLVYGCHMSGSTEANATVGCPIVIACVAEGFGTAFSGCGIISQCISVGPATAGYGQTGVITAQFDRCVVRSSSGAGFSVTGTAVLTNCIATENTGAGYLISAGALATLRSCASWQNTGGRFTPAQAPAADINPIILTASPFVDPANDNFALNNTPGAGAACRGAGWPGAFPFPDRFNTTGFPDVGAAQSQATGAPAASPILSMLVTPPAGYPHGL